MFDIMFLLRTMNIVTENFHFDTMLAQHIVYTDFPKGLDFLTSAYTYFPYYKDEGKKAHLSVVKDWDMYWKYNAKDSAYLIPIMDKLKDELIQFEAVDAMEYTMDLHKPLMEMEFNGILADKKGIAKQKEIYEDEIVALKDSLYQITKKELNINSPKQMQEYFYGICRIKPYVQRSGKGKGNPTCNNVALSRIVRKDVKGSDAAKVIMKIRTISKLVSTYFNIKTDDDNRIRCAHKIAGTSSGRIATERTFSGTGANLQNQPYIFKKFLIPDRKKLLCEIDLQRAEAHAVAFLAQDINMINAFESGIDVHTFSASNIFNISMENVTKDQRQLGKKIVHASNYLMGPQTFSDQLAAQGTFISMGDCKIMLQAYSDRFPSLHRWHEQIRAEVSSTRVLYNMFNRPKRFLGLMNDALFRNAYSYKPQSTVAEVLNRGTIKLCNDDRLGRDGYDIDLLTTVHDSDVFQFDISLCPELYKILGIMKDYMSHEFTYKGRTFTIGLDAKIGWDWAGRTVELSDFKQGTINKALKELGV